MKILITGADGFIGSHLTEELYKKGHTINALVQYNSLNSWGWLEEAKCKNEINIFGGDIRDPFYCKDIIQDMDIIFHLAALIAIPYSYNAPTSYLESNIRGSFNIAKAANDCNVKKLIHMSTSEVYGSAKYIPIDENHPLQPQSPYSASKMAADAMVMSLHNSFNLPLVIARPFNTYGPRQSARAIIPTIISQILSGEKKIYLGNVSTTRDFNFVTDICNGIMALADCDKANGITVNIGSGKETSIRDLFNIIKEIMESDAEIEFEEKRTRPKNSEVQRLCCDNSLIKNLTNFESKIDIYEGLKKTIDWFKIEKNLNNYKSTIYNI